MTPTIVTAALPPGPPWALVSHHVKDGETFYFVGRGASKSAAYESLEEFGLADSPEFGKDTWRGAAYFLREGAEVAP